MTTIRTAFGITNAAAATRLYGFRDADEWIEHLKQTMLLRHVSEVEEAGGVVVRGPECIEESPHGLDGRTWSWLSEVE